MVSGKVPALAPSLIRVIPARSRPAGSINRDHLEALLVLSFVQRVFDIITAPSANAGTSFSLLR